MCCPLRLRPTATRHEGRRQAWLSVNCEPLSCSSQLFPNPAGTLGSSVGASEPLVQPLDEERLVPSLRLGCGGELVSACHSPFSPEKQSPPCHQAGPFQIKVCCFFPAPVCFSAPWFPFTGRLNPEDPPLHPNQCCQNATQRACINILATKQRGAECKDVSSGVGCGGIGQGSPGRGAGQAGRMPPAQGGVQGEPWWRWRFPALGCPVQLLPLDRAVGQCLVDSTPRAVGGQ